jgi:hypothetical protein
MPLYRSKTFNLPAGKSDFLTPHKMVSGFTLSPHSGVLLEKLTVARSVKKFPAFYTIGRFITVFTEAHHWTLF